MARYFLNLHECGMVSLDEDGIEQPDLAAAVAKATEAAREIMAAEIQDGRLCLSCHIDVEDEHHVLLKRLPFRELIALTGL